MKRVFVLLLTAAIMITAAAVVVKADTKTEAVSGYYCGDADGDEIITILDATKIQRLLVSLVTDEDGMIAMRGDVDGNGLEILDATAIQRFLVDFEVSAPIGQWISIIPPTEAQTEVQTEVQTQPPTQKPTRDPDELPFVPIR